MNFGGRDNTDTQFQIAPMLDVVFILLIFFVATYAINQDEKLMDVALPKASSGREESRSLREIVVNLNADGEIIVNRQKYMPEDLEERLKRLTLFTQSPSVVIRADGVCDHRHVVKVMDICARTGVSRISFSTLQDIKSGAADAQ